MKKPDLDDIARVRNKLTDNSTVTAMKDAFTEPINEVIGSLHLDVATLERANLRIGKKALRGLGGDEKNAVESSLSIKEALLNNLLSDEYLLSVFEPILAYNEVTDPDSQRAVVTKIRTFLQTNTEMLKSLVVAVINGDDYQVENTLIWLYENAVRRLSQEKGASSDIVFAASARIRKQAAQIAAEAAADSEMMDHTTRAQLKGRMGSRGYSKEQAENRRSDEDAAAMG